ncbi:MAG: hypothetical protein ACE3JP_15330 [Ectobacillus sp.]
MNSGEEILQAAALIANRSDELFLQCVLGLWSLKQKSVCFERERQVLRTDYLLRGICEKEVDGLLEEPALYSIQYIPKEERWESIMRDKALLEHLINELANKVNLSDKQWEEIIYLIDRGQMGIS